MRAAALEAIARMCAACQGAGAREPVGKVRSAIRACTTDDCPLYDVRLEALEPPDPAIDPARLAAWYRRVHRAAA